MSETKILDNYVELVGTVTTSPSFKYQFKDRKRVCEIFLSVKRLSGTEDIIPIQVFEENSYCPKLEKGKRIKVIGTVRTYNIIGIDEKNHIEHFVLAHDIFDASEEEEDKNEVFLAGKICKKLWYKCTFLSKRRISCFIISNRPSDFSLVSHITCVAWNKTAVKIKEMKEGSEISIHGRFQSRNYMKLFGDSLVEKVTYEISVSKVLSW